MLSLDLDVPKRGQYVAVIGDVVGSRNADEHGRSRAEVQRALDEALRLSNRYVPAVRAPLATVGDEFQGLYFTVAHAIAAVIVVRLALARQVDVRFGLGHGPLTYFGARRGQEHQDGPVWWAARQAIQISERIPQGRKASVHRRTAFVRWAPTPQRRRGTFLDPQQPQLPGMEDQLPAPIVPVPEYEVTGYVNALLVALDELLGHMDGRDARLALDLLAGASVEESAKREEISHSAISQRRRRNGCYAVQEIWTDLTGSIA